MGEDPAAAAERMSSREMEAAWDRLNEKKSPLTVQSKQRQWEDSVYLDGLDFVRPCPGDSAGGGGVRCCCCCCCLAAEDGSGGSGGGVVEEDSPGRSCNEKKRNKEINPLNYQYRENIFSGFHAF